jgi:electron transfer flavoprotein alpha subunit
MKQNDNEYQYIFTRAAINSTVLAQIECINTNISMCTCKENAFVVTEYYPKKKIPVHKWNKNLLEFIFEKNYILHSEYAKCTERNIALENSNLVFGIGRGVRNKDDLNLIKQVAQKHNAMIAGTRAVVEEGMIDKKWQIGQSGISISPEIYVAIGISGATQHIVGIKNAKKVIAINTDENASIFAYSDYCIIDDYKNILNELLQAT